VRNTPQEMSIPIVGRNTERAAVAHFLNRVPDGPVAMLVEGDAGIGKTTVWREAVRAADERGHRVLQARPAEAEASLSFAALADLLGSAYDEVRDEMAAPQRQALDVALLRATPDASADPRTIATALVGVLTALAERGPVVVAVDDVQWLDRASARALEFAARRLPACLGLLIARRVEGDSGAPLGLDRALPDERVMRLRLGPLSLAELHHVIRSRLAVTLARPTLVRLEAASGGNPFYALEIAQALERDTAERALSDPLPVPERLHDLVAARVRTLSDAAQEAVLIAAALSRPTIATVNAALTAAGHRSAGLVEAEESGVLGRERERIRFSHPLLAAAVYGAASRQRRRQLHRRLANVAPDLEERARHLALSATEPDEAVAAELERAAERAARRGAQDAAAELYEASWQLSAPGRPDEVARRQLGEASAHFAASDLTRARALAERAIATAPHGPVRAEGFLLLADAASVAATADAATDYLEQALAEAGEDPALRGRIHARLAGYSTVRPERAATHRDVAIELLDGEQQPGLLAQVLFEKFFAEVELGRGARPDLLQEGLVLEAKAASSSETTLPPSLLSIWRNSLPMAHFRAMDIFDAARARYRAQETWYRERGLDGWRAKELADLAEVELRAGNWTLAEQYIDESCSTIEQAAIRSPWGMPLQIRALIDAHRGRFDRARETLAALIEQTTERWWAAACLSALGFVEFSAGAGAAADEAWTHMTDQLDAIGVKDYQRDRSEPDHVEALLALGEGERARRVLEHLEWRGRTLPRLWIDATLPRARALVLAAEGGLTAALAELERAPVVEQLPFERARLLLVRGRLHRRVKQKLAAAEALREALSIFDRLGAPLWSEQARAELARVGLRRVAGGELSETERRIAELAAQGLTNREIAKAAFISPKTVEANLARVYRKLGIGSRAELGSRMARAGDAGP
jgi:DNA-binding CsgD family transcriptional regulator